MFNAHTEGRLEDERIIWLTTVAPDGQPQTSPVWFRWDGAAIIVYSLDPARRLTNIASNPLVSLNLDGNGSGGDIVTIEGTAIIDHGAPGPDGDPEYVARYRERMDKGWGGPEAFAAKYPTRISITPTRARQW